MKQIFQIQFFIAFIALPFLSMAQAPTITSRADKKDILIGEQVVFEVKVSMPDNTFRLSWFAEPHNLGSFVVASKEKIDSTYSNGILFFSQKLLITSFDSGRQIIPPLEFSFEMLNSDSSFKMYSDSIPVNVSYSPADSVLPFHDIKPIIPVKIQNEWWFWPAVIAGVFVLIIIILIIYFQRKKKKISTNIFDNVLSPYEEAQKNFELLKSQQLPEKGRYNIFFSQLSDIVKKYLSRQQNRNLMSLTGAELIDTINELAPKEKLAGIASSIRMGEAAKFAKYKPSEKDCISAFDEMKNFIEDNHAATKPPADAV